MKLITKTLTVLILLLLCFSCSHDDIITETTSFENKALPSVDYRLPPDDDVVLVSDYYLREFFGYDGYGPTGNPYTVNGIIDKHLNSIYGSYPGGDSDMCEQQDFYIDSSGGLLPYQQTFETWSRPMAPSSSGVQYPATFNSPLNDGVISYQERVALINRIISALSNINLPSNTTITNIDVQASYNSQSPFVYIRVKVETVVCYG